MWLLLIIGFFNTTIVENVDRIELNHYHDFLGRHVFDQYIFYQWDDMEGFLVRDWVLIEPQDPNKIVYSFNYNGKIHNLSWRDSRSNTKRFITSKDLKESWTQVDPERANKSILDERLRIKLVSRNLRLIEN